MTKLGTEKPRPMNQPGGWVGVLGSILLAVSLVAGPFAWAGAARAADAAGQLSVAELVDKVNAMGLGAIYEIEREKNKYEVKVRSSEGVRKKLYLDAATGELLREKRMDGDDWWKLFDDDEDDDDDDDD